jgi:hypothetical protein
MWEVPVDERINTLRFCVNFIGCVQGRAEQVCRRGDIPGGGHPAARDHVWTDQLLGPPGHGLLRTQVRTTVGLHLLAVFWIRIRLDFGRLDPDPDTGGQK